MCQSWEKPCFSNWWKDLNGKDALVTSDELGVSMQLSWAFHHHSLKQDLWNGSATNSKRQAAKKQSNQIRRQTCWIESTLIKTITSRIAWFQNGGT